MITILYDPARRRYLLQRGERFALCVPTEWDDQGNPIEFRRTTEYQAVRVEA